MVMRTENPWLAAVGSDSPAGLTRMDPAPTGQSAVSHGDSLRMGTRPGVRVGVSSASAVCSPAACLVVTSLGPVGASKVGTAAPPSLD